jgi:hypothetical protein
MVYRIEDRRPHIAELEAENKHLRAQVDYLLGSQSRKFLPLGSDCPKCGSAHAGRVFAWRWFGLRAERLNAFCHSCGAEWRELPLDHQLPGDEE